MALQLRAARLERTLAIKPAVDPRLRMVLAGPGTGGERGGTEVRFGGDRAVVVASWAWCAVLGSPGGWMC